MKLIAKTVLLLSAMFFMLGMSVFNSESVDKAGNGSNEYQEYKQVSAKSHMPVDIKYQLAKNIQPGEQVIINLSFKANQLADDLTIMIRTDEGLLLMDTINQYSFGAQKKGQTNALTLNVMAVTEGLFYLYISAALNVEGQQQSGTVVIPVTVGYGKNQKLLKQDGNVTQDSSGSPIISMPALETTD